jgi:hypothetical protein
MSSISSSSSASSSLTSSQNSPPLALIASAAGDFLQRDKFHHTISTENLNALLRPLIPLLQQHVASQTKAVQISLITAEIQALQACKELLPAVEYSDELKTLYASLKKLRTVVRSDIVEGSSVSNSNNNHNISSSISTNNNNGASSSGSSTNSNKDSAQLLEGHSDLSISGGKNSVKPSLKRPAAVAFAIPGAVSSASSKEADLSE